MTYAEAINFLFRLGQFGMKPGLETPSGLAALAGDPHKRLRFIHVAGTNGKGSTCAMLESIYRAAGLRVGLYTSPHLVSFRERIEINRQLIAEADVARLTGEMTEWLKSFSADAQPTFFEVVTVMALKHFAEQRCDLVILETGLGGRLDATNIVTPQASVITNIAFDHTQWLGDTLAKIAFEKAGIIKPGVPVITAVDAAEALAVISEVARSVRAPLRVVTRGDEFDRTIDPEKLPLIGEHQRMNAALAVAAVRALSPQIPVSLEMMQRGLEHIRWPGRLQVVHRGDQTVLLDGAHNPAGVATLRDALAKYFSGRDPVVIVGMLGDKDWPAMARVLAGVASRFLVVPIQSNRALAADRLAASLRSENPRARVEACASVAEALTKVATDPFVVITGSLYLIGEAMELLGVAPTPADDEKGLNEWSTSGNQAAISRGRS